MKTSIQKVVTLLPAVKELKLHLDLIKEHDETEQDVDEVCKALLTSLMPLTGIKAVKLRFDFECRHLESTLFEMGLAWDFAGRIQMIRNGSRTSVLRTPRHSWSWACAMKW